MWKMVTIDNQTRGFEYTKQLGNCLYTIRTVPDAYSTSRSWEACALHWLLDSALDVVDVDGILTLAQRGMALPKHFNSNVEAWAGLVEARRNFNI